MILIEKNIYKSMQWVAVSSSVPPSSHPRLTGFEIRKAPCIMSNEQLRAYFLVCHLKDQLTVHRHNLIDM